MRWLKCQKKWRVLQNHFSIELDDSRLLQFNVHLVWFSKQKTKYNTAFPKQMRLFMSLSEFSIERLADLSISMYHEFCWNPFKGNWHNGKVLHFAFRSQHGPENRVLGGWQDKFFGMPKMWTLPLLLMVIHSAPVEVGSLSLCEQVFSTSKIGGATSCSPSTKQLPSKASSMMRNFMKFPLNPTP